MTFIPTNEQGRAIRAVADWFHNSDKPFFYLAGYAGTGKSTIAKLAVAECGLDPDNSRDVRYGSFTGKAALVMRRKGMHARTIHQLIYVPVEVERNGVRVVEFRLDEKYSPVREVKLVVLDECSMIHAQMARDLLSFGTKILVLGDPGQLPPVGGEGYFTRDPDFFLQEVHRQALDSPILHYAHEARNGNTIPIIRDGAFRNLPDISDLTPEDLLSVDQVIAGKNKTRWGLNALMLSEDGFGDNMIYPTLPGVKVMCIRNDHERGFLNGMIGRTNGVCLEGEVDHDYRMFSQEVVMDDVGNENPFAPVDETPVLMRMGYFEQNFGLWNQKTDEPKDEKIYADYYFKTDERPAFWDYGYAITAHKAQGSQFDSIIVANDDVVGWKNDGSQDRWLYTAITRAVNRITIVGCKGI